MQYKHTGRVQQQTDSTVFRFPGHAISIEFSHRFPKPDGNWRPTSLFCLKDNHSILLLKADAVGAFWLLDENFHLKSNDHIAIQQFAEHTLLLTRDCRYDRALASEVLGLVLYYNGADRAALAALVQACNEGELQDAESFAALITLSSKLAEPLNITSLIATSFLSSPLFMHEEAANLKLRIGRFCAEKLDFTSGHKFLVEAVADLAELPDWLPGLLDHCSRNDLAAVFADPPALLKAEIAELNRAAHDFLAGRECNWGPGRFPTMTVALHWIRQTVRTIHLTTGDLPSLGLLQAGGVSPVFLQAIVRGRDGVGEACFAASMDLPFASDPTISLRVKEVAATLLLGGKPILCPFTGDRDLARDTINLHTFLHRKNGRTCIIFSDPDISLAPADSAWFFPDLNILLTFGWNMRPEIELATTLQRVLDNIRDVESYLADPERKVMISEEGMGHIGHYIWNVISGWKHLFDLADAGLISVLTSYQHAHFFGGVTELYENEIKPIAHVLRLIDRTEAFGAMLKHRGMSLILRDRNVTHDVAQRVQAWCMEHVPGEFLSMLASFRKTADPIVMITIRLGNRAWIEQENGFIQIITALKAEYSGLGIIIEGLNAPPPGTSTFATMSITSEQAIAERIIAACPTVNFCNAVGCTPAEGVLWCTVIDAFLAPIGAGLAKSRWISNKPGVGYSNRTFLEEGHFEGYLYSHFREEPSAMLYVGREHISDVDDGNHGQIGRANFSMDWRAPLAELRRLFLNLRDYAGHHSL